MSSFWMSYELFLDLRHWMSERIHSWAHRHLNFGVHFTLIKSTLSAILLQYLQVMKPTDVVLHMLEQLMARFHGNH